MIGGVWGEHSLRRGKRSDRIYSAGWPQRPNCAVRSRLRHELQRWDIKPGHVGKIGCVSYCVVYEEVTCEHSRKTGELCSALCVRNGCRSTASIRGRQNAMPRSKCRACTKRHTQRRAAQSKISERARPFGRSSGAGRIPGSGAHHRGAPPQDGWRARFRGTVLPTVRGSSGRQTASHHLARLAGHRAPVARGRPDSRKQTPTIDRLSDEELQQRYFESTVRAIAKDPAIAICVLRNLGWRVEWPEKAVKTTNDPCTTTGT